MIRPGGGNRYPMPLLFAIIATVVISALALALFSIWGLPVIVATVLVLALYVVMGRRGDGTVGTFEKQRQPEPTGTPRKASGAADTANERVGQA